MVTGSDLAQSQQAIDLAKRYPGRCYATVGVHPCAANSFEEEDEGGRGGGGGEALLETLEAVAREGVRGVGWWRLGRLGWILIGWGWWGGRCRRGGLGGRSRLRLRYVFCVFSFSFSFLGLKWAAFSLCASSRRPVGFTVLTVPAYFEEEKKERERIVLSYFVSC